MRIFDLGNILFVLKPETGAWGLSSKRNIKKLEKKLECEGNKRKEYRNVGLFVLNTTTCCNLNCVYCSAKRGELKRLNIEVGKRTVDVALESKNRPHIVFHGSEPLLNFDDIKRIVEYGVERQGNEKIDFSIQTNLTLLSNDVIDFIKNNKIGVSTSIDGEEELHNLTRPYMNGEGSYKDVVKGIERVLQFQDGMSIVSVITKHNVKELNRVMRGFEQIGATSVQFIPVVSCHNVVDVSPTAYELLEGYVKLFQETIERLRKSEQKINVTNLAQYLSSLFFRTPIDACRQCSPSEEHPLLAIDTNGDIYPCDFFWGERELISGNITKDSLLSIINNKNNLRLRDIENTSCSECDWRKICGGGCLGDTYYSSKRGFSKPQYCETHKGVYEYLVRKLPEILREGLLSKILNWTTS